LCPVNSVPNTTHDTEEFSVLSPDGNSARRFSEGTTNLTFALTRTFSTTLSVEQGKQYNYSCFIKVGSANRAFRLQWDGATTSFGNPIVLGFNPQTESFFSSLNVQSSGYEIYPNGWYRFWFVTPVATTSSSTITPRIYIVNTTNSQLTNGYDNSTNLFVYYYGPQITTGPKIRPYVRTEGVEIPLSNRVFDLSGNGNIGTLRNSPTYSEDNLGKFVLDGVNDDIDCGNNSSINFGTGDFTVSVWFRRFSNATTNLRLLSKAAGGDSANAASAGFCFFGSNTGISFAVNPTAARTIISAANFSVNEWVNVVGLVERGVSMRTYKNSVQVATATAPTGSVSGTTSLFLGSNVGANVFWAGEISNVSLYNKALTPQEIQQNFNALRGRFGI
jgi:hypothetical protein